MNTEFNEKLALWVNEDADKKNYAEGALMLLQLNGNQIMYRNVSRNPKKYAEFIDRQLNKYLKARLAVNSHKMVVEMQKQVEGIVKNRNLDVTGKKPSNEFKAGKRADHEKLPDEIQALYVENLSILQKMRELHLKLRTLSTNKVSCPDSERFPFLKELIRLDKKIHSNWEQYDNYTGENGEKKAEVNAREESKKASRAIHLAKARFIKKPTESQRKKIIALYEKIISPNEKLTSELKELGIIK